jgi:HAAS domain-containing protein
VTDDELVAGYLRQIKRASRTLPRPVRRELMEEIAGHIAEARAAGGDPAGDGSAALRTVLDQLGDPRDIAHAAAASAREDRPGGLEITAVAFLLGGGLLGLAVGAIFSAGALTAITVWLAGAVMLWSSPRWRLPDKILGSLVWPGGLALSFVLASRLAPALPPWLGIPLAIVLIAAPLAVAIWLVHRARAGGQRDPAVPELVTR